MFSALHTVRQKPLIIFLSVVIVIFALLILIPRPTPSLSSVPSVITPTIQTSPPLSSFSQLITSPSPTPINNLQTLISKLPHKTPDYIIEHTSHNSTFYISVYTQPYSDHELQAKKFIQQYIPDISTLNIKVAYFPPSPAP